VSEGARRGQGRGAARVTRLLAAAVLTAAGPLPAQRAAVPADGEWPSAARDPANTRFSPLADITADNVGALQPAWSWVTGSLKGHEAAPLVVDGTMYVVLPYPNQLVALDLAKPGTVRWTYDPAPAPAAQGVACCDVVNRGAAYERGTLFYNTLDAHTVAVDARTGREKWRTRLGDIRKGESMTMAPLVAKGRVIVGVSGGEFGVRGWAAALDAATGRLAWRAYSTGPDREVLIGDGFRPWYAQDRGTDLGVRTWPPGAWQVGGGGIWGFISYDAELDLLYYGTANPGPWAPSQRPGDNKWTSGIFARDPATGAARWFYQFSPHDLYDWDGVNENVLVTLPLGGEPRRVLLHPDRNGFLYVIDRATGEVLSTGKYFPHGNAMLGVDLASGRPTMNPRKGPVPSRVIRDVCPAAPGAKDWNPSAWSPRTGLLYIPHNNLCMDMQELSANYIAGTPYVGTKHKYVPGPGGHAGYVTAWDPVRQAAAWRIPEEFPVWSGALVTAGDVMFYGTMDGWFKALDARTGRELWRHRLPSGIVSQPVSYRGPDGKQYVAVLSGVGGWAGAIVSNDLDPRDSLAGNGWGAATGSLRNRVRKGGALHVFALP
jgi:PQQ-dependent dehydrogenase (methanol/ethanol family)